MKIEKSIPDLLEFSIINVDKPEGITSFVCADRVRRVLEAKKSGHFGTLDLGVSGVLPVALNRACRLSNYFMKKDKEYIGKMLIHKEINERELKKEMDAFLGKIMQKPPVRSRVKRILRVRSVNKFKIIKKEGKVVEFIADVSAGTYIRKLISDLGLRIGGAHMISLRRIRSGIFYEKESFSLEQVKHAYEEYKCGNEKELRKMLIPAEIIDKIIPRVNVKDDSIKKLLNGKPLMKEDLVGSLSDSKDIEDSKIVVFNQDRFLGVYKKYEKDNIIAIPEFILS